MKLVPLYTIFDIEFPRTLTLNEQTFDEKGYNFVSSKGSSNGISARVSEISTHKRYKAGAITVSLKGSVLSAFLQNEDFYIAHQNAVLYPKKYMTNEEKLFYCMCISANKFRYNYGRQADRTISELLVPEKVPNEFIDIELSKINKPIINSIVKIDLTLDIDNWSKFKLIDIFEIKKGKRLTKEDMINGYTPFIGAIDSNNGWRDFIDQNPLHNGNTITVNYNGSVAEAFYQPLPFWASDDVNVLYPKFNLNVYIAMFIISIIKLEKYRFNYGRKWNKDRMELSEIHLPSIHQKPDFIFMENYIKSLPYSASLKTNKDIKIIKPLVASKPKEMVKKQKGLTDAELAAKYELGGIELSTVMEPMLQTPSNSSTLKKSKKK